MLPVNRVPWILGALASSTLAMGVARAQVPPAPPGGLTVEGQAATTPPHDVNVVAPATTPAGDNFALTKRPNACASGAEFDAFKQEISVAWVLETKSDGAPLKDFPVAPAAGSALGTWAANIAASLLTALNDRLSDEQQQEFSSLESRTCPSRSLYCRIAFRQDAVVMLLPK